MMPSKTSEPKTCRMSEKSKTRKSCSFTTSPALPPPTRVSVTTVSHAVTTLSPAPRPCTSFPSFAPTRFAVSNDSPPYPPVSRMNRNGPFPSNHTPTKMRLSTSSNGTPNELVDNRIFVGVWLEGKGPFRFILDTGGYGGLSLETAKRVGAKLGNEVQGRGAGESVVTAWETVVTETRVGGGKAGLVLKEQDFRVFDFSDMRHVFGSAVFDGIIGLPGFSRAVVRVDYGRRLLTFTKPSSFSYRGKAAPAEFELERFLPIVRGEVDGLACRLGLDTGDRSAFTLKGPFVEEHRLRERYAPKFEAVTGWGIGGPVRSQVVRLPSLKFAGFEFRETLTRLSLQKSGAFNAND